MTASISCKSQVHFSRRTYTFLLMDGELIIIFSQKQAYLNQYRLRCNYELNATYYKSYFMNFHDME